MTLTLTKNIDSGTLSRTTFGGTDDVDDVDDEDSLMCIVDNTTCSLLQKCSLYRI